MSLSAALWADLKLSERYFIFSSAPNFLFSIQEERESLEVLGELRGVKRKKRVLEVQRENLKV